MPKGHNSSERNIPNIKDTRSISYKRTDWCKGILAFSYIPRKTCRLGKQIIKITSTALTISNQAMALIFGRKTIQISLLDSLNRHQSLCLSSSNIAVFPI
ncbi:hypothetical protein PanWU01x14_142170 [Parasponia andersonii]|uniref:Uncharacterized protein n=1 Tax=Parasponia andersonii TaxID=3476 RepID=A0A2P5CLY3_PARAD|nr:hypothetical protein PanWU01x14_142170 [Parasponia andersonii]